jgi:hypothetical protein
VGSTGSRLWCDLVFHSGASVLNKSSVIYAVCSYIWERNFVGFLYVLNFSPHEHYKTDKEIEYTEFYCYFMIVSLLNSNRLAKYNE